MQRASFIALMLALSACGGKRSGKSPPPADAAVDTTPDAGPVSISPEPKLPPAAQETERSFGRGGQIVYPRRVPLVYGPGVAPLDPPMRVQRIFAVPGRPLAVATGRSKAGPTVMLIDVDGGRVRWIDTALCKAPVVHTTSDRIICAGWKGVVALDVDGGDQLWKVPHKFRAAHQRWVFAVEEENPGRGFIIDVQTGKQVVEVTGDKKTRLDDIKELCADKKGFDLYAWTDAGSFNRYHVRAEKLPTPARRTWTRSFGIAPSKVDLCDGVLLIETPIPGKAERTLRAVNRGNGRDAAEPLAVRGWWESRSAPEHIETATAEGLQERTRLLKMIERTAAGPIGGRLVAAWDKLRLIRGGSGTLVLLGAEKPLAWLAAPAGVERAVLTSRRILGGSWLSPPQSDAERMTLWEIPAPSAGIVSPSLPQPGRASLGNLHSQRAPPVSGAGTVYAHPRAGGAGVTHVHLSSDRVYVATVEARPGPNRGAGVAAFDLTRRKWIWHRENACTANASVVGVVAGRGAVVCAAARHYPDDALVIARDPDSGKKTWRVRVPTVDWVDAAGDAVVIAYGTRALVVDARTGKLAYELESDNGHAPRVVPVAAGLATRVISVERGLLVARDPAAGGKVVWSARVKGYVRGLSRVLGGVAVSMAQGELYIVSATDGSATAAGTWAPGWEIPGGDLILERPLGSSGEQVLRAHSLDGSERFAAAYNLVGKPGIALLREPTPGAPILMVSYHGAARMIRISASTGALEATYRVPPRALRNGAFSAYVSGKVVVGLVLQKPLAIQLF